MPHTKDTWPTYTKITTKGTSSLKNNGNMNLGLDVGVFSVNI